MADYSRQASELEDEVEEEKARWKT